MYLVFVHITAFKQAMSVEKDKPKVHKLSLKGNLLPVRVSYSCVAIKPILVGSSKLVAEFVRN